MKQDNKPFFEKNEEKTYGFIEGGIFKKTILILAFTGLASCASMNSEFNCPAGRGVGCKNIHDVNQMVNDGKLGSNEKRGKFHVKSVQPLASNVPTSKAASPMRTQEKTLSIWIAPYEDKSGNYHDATTIHAVVQNGEWEPAFNVRRTTFNVEPRNIDTKSKTLNIER